MLRSWLGKMKVLLVGSLSTMSWECFSRCRGSPRVRGWSERPVPGAGQPASWQLGPAWLPRAKHFLCGQYSSGQWILPEERTLVGALDLGGASTQISFAPQGPILDQSTQATFRLYGANYSIYTHSYLCFGRDQVLTRLLAKLAQVRLVSEGWRSGMAWGRVGKCVRASSSCPFLSLQNSSLVRHPCYHSGYLATLPLAPLHESPCVHTTDSLNLTQNLTVEGIGNPGECVAALRSLFNFSSCEDQEDCAFNGVYQPPVHGQFYVSIPPPSPGFLLGPQVTF